MEWRYLDSECCPRCGDLILCETPKHLEDGMFLDGSLVKCIACDYKSGVSVSGSGTLLQED